MEINDIIINAILCALQAGLVMTAADLTVALGHFSLDSYADSSRGPEFLRALAKANQLHHARPLEFTTKTLLENARETALIGVAIVLLACLAGVLSWQVWLYAVVIGASAAFHRFQHLPIDQVPCLIKLLQAVGLLQSRRQHADHHRVHHAQYAIMLSWTNPLLETIQAPRFVKGMLKTCCEIKALDIKLIAEALRREWKEQRT